MDGTGLQVAAPLWFRVVVWIDQLQGARGVDGHFWVEKVRIIPFERLTPLWGLGKFREQGAGVKLEWLRSGTTLASPSEPWLHPTPPKP